MLSKIFLFFSSWSVYEFLNQAYLEGTFKFHEYNIRADHNLKNVWGLLAMKIVMSDYQVQMSLEFESFL